MAKTHNFELTDNQFKELIRIAGQMLAIQTSNAGQRVTVDHLTKLIMTQNELLEKYNNGEVNTSVVLDNYLSLMAILEDGVSEYGGQLDNTTVIAKDTYTFLEGIF
ncbi:hypothetical protein D1831_13195 [Lactiplantibacillus garii]|uniref:Uncharacterized protein n=1 Tax=Lactiplantibacillus garii TaxID=2306423 RepID=A0A3R8J563_9LACO|nr:hypothetical protein [Lactiplantibacillus garii]RRK09356.1 hypothetical protein D1831_13195 [Lactiplantibacillus garii]